MGTGLTDFWMRVAETYEEHAGGWRFGQCAFNVLGDMRPDLAEDIRGTRADPFHDRNWDGFMVYLAANWERKEENA